MRHLAFLHTSPVHVPTFEGVVRQADPALQVDHVVREDLLAHARARGVDHPEIVRGVRQAMQDAAAGGAALVVCTCSTIGGVAEATPMPAGSQAARIDRAMADRAVRGGGRVLVVTALRSTLEPTLELLRGSARRGGVEVELETLCVEQAWSLFERGDRGGYLEAIAGAVRSAAPPGRRVVLAQASMAPVAGMLEGEGREVLASPALGVEAALRRLAAGEGQSGRTVPRAGRPG